MAPVIKPEQYAKELAAYIKNGEKDLADLTKTYNALAAEIVTHGTIEKHQTGLASEFADEVTRVVSDAKSLGMTGTTLADFTADRDVKDLINQILTFNTRTVLGHGQSIKKLQTDAAALLKDTGDFIKPLVAELAIQTKASATAKGAGFDKKELAKLEDIIDRGNKLLKAINRDVLSEANGIGDYTKIMMDDWNDKLKHAMARSRADLKKLEDVEFSKLIFDHRRIKKNAGVVKTLHDEIAGVVKAKGRFQLAGPSSQMTQEKLDKLVAAAKTKAAGVAKINAVHTKEWLALGKDGMNSMTTKEDGKKSHAFLESIDKHAESVAKMVKFLNKAPDAV